MGLEMVSVSWWCNGLAIDVLAANSLSVAPWLGGRTAVPICAIDVDTTSYDAETGQIWQIGIATGVSFPHELKLTGVENIVVDTPAEAVAGSAELVRRLPHYASEDEAMRALAAELAGGASLPSALTRAVEVVEDAKYVACGQGLASFDIPWIERKFGRRVLVHNPLDTGMLVKSAAIPTLRLADESAADFYERIGARRMPFRYGIDGFVVPALSAAGMLEPPNGKPGTPQWRNAAYDAYASLVMVHAIRGVCLAGSAA